MHDHTLYSIVHLLAFDLSTIKTSFFADFIISAVMQWYLLELMEGSPAQLEILPSSCSARDLSILIPMPFRLLCSGTCWS